MIYFGGGDNSMDYIPILYNFDDIIFGDELGSNYIKMANIVFEASIEGYNIGMELFVKNNGFQCESNYFDVHSKDFFRFLNDISTMYNNLIGVAHLKSYHFPSFMSLSTKDGIFNISGTIIEEDWGKQGNENRQTSLNFSFNLDQTFFKSIANKYKDINRDNYMNYVAKDMEV